MQRISLPAVAVVAAVVGLGLQASAQVPPVVVTTSSDDADFDTFPKPAGSLVRTGPFPQAFLRSEGEFAPPMRIRTSP